MVGSIVGTGFNPDPVQAATKSQADTTSARRPQPDRRRRSAGPEIASRTPPYKTPHAIHIAHRVGVHGSTCLRPWSRGLTHAGPSQTAQPDSSV